MLCRCTKWEAVNGTNLDKRVEYVDALLLRLLKVIADGHRLCSAWECLHSRLHRRIRGVLSPIIVIILLLGNTSRSVRHLRYMTQFDFNLSKYFVNAKILSRKLPLVSFHRLLIKCKRRTALLLLTFKRQIQFQWKLIRIMVRHTTGFERTSWLFSWGVASPLPLSASLLPLPRLVFFPGVGAAAALAVPAVVGSYTRVQLTCNVTSFMKF